MWISVAADGKPCRETGLFQLELFDKSYLVIMELISQFMSGIIGKDVLFGSLQQAELTEVQREDIFSLIDEMFGVNLMAPPTTNRWQNYGDDEPVVEFEPLEFMSDTDAYAAVDDVKPGAETSISRKLLSEFDTTIEEAVCYYTPQFGPRQTNGDDCGFFVALYLVQQTFPSEVFITCEVVDARQWIAVSLCEGNLSYLVDGRLRLAVPDKYNCILDDLENLELGFKTDIMRKPEDVKRLTDKGKQSWANDVVINLIVDLIHKKQQASKTPSYIAVMDSYFRTQAVSNKPGVAMRLLTKYQYDVDILTSIVCPINIDLRHWGFIGIGKHNVFAYDPLGLEAAERSEYYVHAVGCCII